MNTTDFLLNVAPIISIVLIAAWLTIVFGCKYLENQRPDAYEQWCRESRARDPNFKEPYVWAQKDGRMQRVHRSEVDPVYKAEYDAREAKLRAEATIDPKTL